MKDCQLEHGTVVCALVLLMIGILLDEGCCWVGSRDERVGGDQNDGNRHRIVAKQPDSGRGRGRVERRAASDGRRATGGERQAASDGRRITKC